MQCTGIRDADDDSVNKGGNHFHLLTGDFQSNMKFLLRDQCSRTELFLQDITKVDAFGCKQDEIGKYLINKFDPYERVVSESLFCLECHREPSSNEVCLY